MRSLPVILSVIGFSTSLLGGPVDRQKAIFLHERLTGVPPSAEVLAQMEGLIEKGKLEEAADIAIKDEKFLSITVKNWAAPSTNEGQSVDVPLNDYTATVVGYVRDGLDFRGILSDDTIYAPAANPQVAPYAPNSNDSYEQFEALGLSYQTLLEKRTQTELNPALGVVAGVMTTRGFGESFYKDGTNRAPLEYTFINYICRDMSGLTDITRPDNYVRRDVDRLPGGDGEKYRTECVGCHSGMDPLTKAFAYLDFIEGEDNPGQIVYTAGAPVEKVNRNNDTFPDGAVVEDDKWTNIWFEGANAELGWDPEKKTGTGPKSWGEMVAATTMFPDCMAQRVYKKVCLKM